MRYVYNPLLGLNFDLTSGLNDGEQGYTEVVTNYSALPDPTTVPNKFYFVEEPQGTSWLPGSLGGTYYPSGTYYSNGIIWNYQVTPYQATQAAVNAGIVTDQFVSPATLAAYTGTTLQKAYNNGSIISVTDTFGSVIFRNTRALDTSIIYEVKNIAGTTTFSVNGNGTILAGDGTISNPAYSFVNNTSTGWYSAGANDIRFSLGGTIRLQVTGSDGWSFNNNIACHVDGSYDLGSTLKRFKDLYLNGIARLSGTTATTSVTTGTLVVAGGVGIANGVTIGQTGSNEENIKLYGGTSGTSTSTIGISRGGGISGGSNGFFFQTYAGSLIYQIASNRILLHQNTTLSGGGFASGSFKIGGGGFSSAGYSIEFGSISAQSAGVGFNLTSGIAGYISIGTGWTSNGFTPTTGTAIFNALNIGTVINQTGTASGTVRGIYYNPTVTSVLGPHYGWESTSGDIKFGGTTQKTYFNDLYILDFDSTTYKKALTGNTVTNQLNVGEDFTNGIRVFNKFGLGVTPASVQTGGAATATSVYTATEQSMLQKVYDMARTFGFLT